MIYCAAFILLQKKPNKKPGIVQEIYGDKKEVFVDHSRWTLKWELKPENVTQAPLWTISSGFLSGILTGSKVPQQTAFLTFQV